MKRILMLAAFAFIVDVYAEGMSFTKKIDDDLVEAEEMSFTKKIDDDLVEDDDLDEKVDEEFSEELDTLQGKSTKDHLLNVLRKAYKLAEEYQNSEKFNGKTKGALKAVYNATKRAMGLLSKESDDDEI